jgi:two-component system OmpR family sensor kinase
MSSRFARRLLFIASLEIGAVLAVLIVTGTLFAFGSYVGSIRSEANATIAQLIAALAGTTSEDDAVAAAKVVQARYLRSDLIVVLLDANHRVAVYRLHRPDRSPAIVIQQRGEVPRDPAAGGPLVLPIEGLATAFGLQNVRGHVGRVDIYVKENEVSLVSEAGAFAWPVFLAIVFAFGVGFAIARALVHQMVRPLLDVQHALERFASGDLTPQPIATANRGEFGDLAVAYNGAIDQVERAFAQRDSANAAIRQFIADAGHQLRTPLTVIRGFIAILRKGDLRTPADRDRILETMNRQSAVMASLIDKLMLLERWERDVAVGPPEPIDVAQLVDDVATPIAEANPARHVAIVAQPGPLAAIDPSDLAYAITNLVDNALKYTTGAVEVRVRPEGGSVVVEIADHGPGMTPGEVRHVFDRFYRGSRRDVDGSGLGLSIAKRAVERAGGSIDVTTDTAAGSTFTIRLPQAARARRESAALT